MADYYVRPGDGGADAGTAANPFLTFKQAVAVAASGDNIYIDTVTNGFDIINNAGGEIDLASSGTGLVFIHVYGTDGAWNPGTQATIQGEAGDLPVNLLDTNGHDYWWWHNITFDGATTYCMYRSAGTTVGMIFEDCAFINAASTVYGSDNISGCSFLRCSFGNATAYGFYRPASGCVFEMCEFYSCNIAIDVNSANVWRYCVFRDITADMIYCRVSGGAQDIIGCVFDTSAAGSGIWVHDGTSNLRVRHSAFTNLNQFGIEVDVAADARNWEDYNGFLNNGADRQNIAVGANSFTFAADPYVNRAGNDHTTSDTATNRRRAIQVGV